MIKNIIFDFGDIFINLDKQATLNALEKYQVRGNELPYNLIETVYKYEKGEISTEKFIHRFVDYFRIPSDQEFIDIWNSILLDFPKHRLEFMKEISKQKQFRLFLLSNTNELHINWIKNNWGMELYDEFKNCFEQFYLSHEINLRKPNHDIFRFVLEKNNLKPNETMFIDDTKENTDSAKELGMRVWNLSPGLEDVSELLNKPFYR